MSPTRARKTPATGNSKTTPKASISLAENDRYSLTRMAGRTFSCWYCSRKNR